MSEAAEPRDYFRGYQSMLDMLGELGQLLESGQRPTELFSEFGVHRIAYVDESVSGGGSYARLEFKLPEGICAEVCSDTYGDLTALRIPLPAESSPGGAIVHDIDR